MTAHVQDAEDTVSAVYRKHLSSGRARLADLLGGHVETESDGAWLTTASGARFLNVGGYGVLIMGSKPARVVEEIKRQLDTHPTASRVFLEPSAARAAELLMDTVPDGLERVHFAGSGAEATEAAIKIARLNGRRRLISMTGGYHGKTLGALSITARRVYQDPFRPLLPGVSEVPFGDVEALRAELMADPEPACVVVEPVQGEAGVIVPPPGYIKAVRDLCTSHEALLVLDEIQTGLGRLGSWWGADRDGVCPDILLSGKALGGGIIPVSAAITSNELFAALDRDPILHTSTFSAAPVGMAAVVGAIRTIHEENLVDKASVIGERILGMLNQSLASHIAPERWTVRGVGLLIGIEFRDPLLAGDLYTLLIEHRILANFSLNSDYVVRLTPPATMSELDLEFLSEKFDAAVRALAHHNPKG